MQAENRACLEWACRIVYGIGPETEIYIRRDGVIVWDHLFKIIPNANTTDASIATLAQMMKLHLGGTSFAKLRNDLIRSGVGEEFANRVHDHLVDISVEEWGRLRERTRWYGDDNGAPILATTEASGGS